MSSKATIYLKSGRTVNVNDANKTKQEAFDFFVACFLKPDVKIYSGDNSIIVLFSQIEYIVFS